eukprot:gene9442-1682_t
MALPYLCSASLGAKYYSSTLLHRQIQQEQADLSNDPASIPVTRNHTDCHQSHIEEGLLSYQVTGDSYPMITGNQQCRHFSAKSRFFIWMKAQMRYYLGLRVPDFSAQRTPELQQYIRDRTFTFLQSLIFPTAYCAGLTSETETTNEYFTSTPGKHQQRNETNNTTYSQSANSKSWQYSNLPFYSSTSGDHIDEPTRHVQQEKGDNTEQREPCEFDELV